VPRDRDKPRRKKPAYPKVGSGEDFPARRPGTKVGETSSGQKQMQPTRASQARSLMTYRRNVGARRFKADPIPPATSRRGEPFQVRVGPNRSGRPTGRRRYPFSHGVRGKPTLRNPWPL
jgi:hypothetical protein